MLHEALKDKGEAERPAGDTKCRLSEGLSIDLGSVWPGVLRKEVEVGPRQELLMGLGIYPDTMKMKVRAHEPERSPDGGSPAKTAGGNEQHGRRLSCKLLEAFSLLCQAGRRFMSYMYR
jgi:hypothetical protein